MIGVAKNSTHCYTHWCTIFRCHESRSWLTCSCMTFSFQNSKVRQYFRCCTFSCPYQRVLFMFRIACIALSFIKTLGHCRSDAPATRSRLQLTLMQFCRCYNIFGVPWGGGVPGQQHSVSALDRAQRQRCLVWLGCCVTRIGNIGAQHLGF